MKCEIVSSEGFDRLRRGHPWLFASQLNRKYRFPEKPCVMAVGEHWFFYSPRSEIRLRRLGPATRNWLVSDQTVVSEQAAFAALFGPKLRELLTHALQAKLRLSAPDRCFRWVFSEMDLIPGLSLDVFEETVVAQLQTAPIEEFWPTLRPLIEEVYIQLLGSEPKIIEMRNAPARKHEGLPVVADEDREPVAGRWRRWNGLEWWIKAGGPQKTGSYLDQKDNHRVTLEWAQRLGLREAWDFCSFEGGFGLHLAKAGIKVLAVDQSEEALAVAHQNAVRNGVLPENYETLAGDVFEIARRFFDEGRRTELIVLDPPSFVKSKAQKEGALRGFKELNLRAMHCLKPGGLLVSCACSHNISREDYGRMLARAGHDARRGLKILEVRGPAADHAPLLGFPESEYLQAWFLEIQ